MRTRCSGFSDGEKPTYAPTFPTPGTPLGSRPPPPPPPPPHQFKELSSVSRLQLVLPRVKPSTSYLSSLTRCALPTTSTYVPVLHTDSWGSTSLGSSLRTYDSAWKPPQRAWLLETAMLASPNRPPRLYSATFVRCPLRQIQPRPDRF